MKSILRIALAAIPLALMLMGSNPIQTEDYYNKNQDRVFICNNTARTLYHHSINTAIQHDLPEHLLAAIAWRESRWNPYAYTNSGPHPAEGLMQIVPYWHPSMKEYTYDPCASLHYAAHYLKNLTRTHGTLSIALKKYSGNANGYVIDIFKYMRHAYIQTRHNEAKLDTIRIITYTG